MIDAGGIAALGGTGFLVIGGLIKIGRQTGRIEEGVSGLYARVERLERQIDRRVR